MRWRCCTRTSCAWTRPVRSGRTAIVSSWPGRRSGSRRARAAGFFPEILRTHYQAKLDLGGHVSHKGVPVVVVARVRSARAVDGADVTYAATLRQSVAHVRDAERRRMRRNSTWEAVLFAAHHRLGNLVAVVDCNKIKSASVAETLALELPKWRAFGWSVS
jgi:transketolase